MENPDPGVDQSLVDLAESGHASISDIEMVVRSYMLYADQERPPAEDPRWSRNVRIRRGSNGTGQVMVTLSDTEIEERALLARAGLILGPYERVGRLPWWLRRIERGGVVLCPGPQDRPLQYIDGRDLAG